MAKFADDTISYDGEARSDGNSLVEEGIVDTGTIDNEVEQAPVKRSRGRPRKDSSSGTGEAGTRTKRTYNKSSANTSLDVGTVTFIVALTGNFIAESLKSPSLSLSLDEASTIGQAVVNVGRHYDIPVSAVTQAWIGLAGCLGTIYGPKIMSLRRKKEQADAPSSTA